MKPVFSFRYCCLPLLTLLCPLSVQADPYSFHLALGGCQLEVDATQNDPDFNRCNTYAMRGGYRVTSGFALEGGYQYFNDSTTDRQTDLAGSYDTVFNSGNFLLGAELSLPLTEQLRPYLRAGGLHYEAKFTVHEYFEGDVEGGKDQIRDSGFGYYAGAGLEVGTRNSLMFTLELQQQVMPDLFSDSARPFDARYYSIMVGVGL